MKHDASSSRFSSTRFARAERGPLAGFALAVVLSLLLTLMPARAVVKAAPAAPVNAARGQVVVQFGDHDLVARDISFTAPISGLDALQLTGLDVVTADTGYGPLVCSIDGVGCPASDCFCQCQGPQCTYWSYNYWDGSVWKGHDKGAGDSTVNDGAVEGWRWGQLDGSWNSPAMWPALPVQAALKALDWLRPQQSATDGGFGGDGGSAEALLAIGANGYAASDWQREPATPSLAGYWLRRAPAYSRTSGDAAGKLAVGLMAAETCWPRDAVYPSASYNATSGSYAAGAGPQAWAILGTAALAETVPENAIAYLKSLVQPSGGWEWGPGWGADTNATALALQALIATGESNTSALITQGLAYLRSAQNPDGGFPYSPDSPWGTASDANSTAYVIQAARATGEDPTGAAWTKGAHTPVSYLLSLQLPDGSFEWQPGQGSNQSATRQAVPALLGRPFPLDAAQAALCPARFLPLISH